MRRKFVIAQGCTRGALLSACAAIALPRVAVASTYVWKGGAPNNNWSQPANWLNSSVPPAGSDLDFSDLFFTGIKYLSPNMDADESMNSLVFVGVDSFDLQSSGSHTLTLGAGGLGQTSSVAQSIEFGINLGADQTWAISSGAGNVNLNGGADTNGKTLTISAGGTNTISGNISGSGSLLKTGAGTLTLDGATYSGNTTVSAGSFVIGSSSSIGSGNSGNAFTLSGGATATLQGNSDGSGGKLTADIGTIGNGSSGTFTQLGGTYSANAVTVGKSTNGNGIYNMEGGHLSVGDQDLTIGATGTGSFNQTGGLVTASTVEFAFNGGVGSYTLSGGTLSTLEIVSATFESAQGVFNFNGGTLQASATSPTPDSSLLVGIQSAFVQAKGAILDSNGFTNSIAQPLLHDSALGPTVDGGLTKNGAGTFTLRGANTYTGNTTVNSGTLAIGAGGSVGVSSSNVTLWGGAVMTLDGSNDGTNGSLTSNILIVGNDGNSSFMQTGGTNHTNTLVLGSSSGPTVNGKYTLTGGILNVGVIVKSGVGTGTFNFNGGALQIAQSSSNFMSGIAHLNVQAGGAIIDTLSNQITLLQPLLHDSSLGTTPDGGLTKQGPGTLTLGIANTYTGDITVTNGTLQLGLNSALPTTTNIVTSSVSDPHGHQLSLGTLDLNGFSQIAATLSGNGAVSSNGGTLTLTLGTQSLYSGSINGGNTAPGSLILDGAGIEILTGTGYFGGGGVNSSPAYTVATGTLFGTTSNLANAIVVGATGTLGFNQNVAGNFAGSISGAGSVTIGGTGVVTFTQANTYSGSTIVLSGALAVSDDNQLGTSFEQEVKNPPPVYAPLVFQGGTLRTTAAIVSGRALEITYAGGTIDTDSQSPTFAGTISELATTIATTTMPGTGTLTLIGGGTVTFGGLGPDGSRHNSISTLDAMNASAANAVIDGGTFTLNDTTSAATDLIVGGGSVTVQTSASLNTSHMVYIAAPSGQSNPEAGSMIVTGPGTHWDAGAGEIFVGDLASTGSLTVENRASISGSGTLNLGGESVASTLTVQTVGALHSGAASVGAATTIPVATVRESGSWTIGGSLTIGAHIPLGQLSLLRVGEVNVSDPGSSIAVSGVTNLAATSTINVNTGMFSTGALASYPGDATAINITNAPLGAVALTIGSNTAGDTTFYGTIADGANGAGGIAKIGSNTQTLAGTNTYTGSTAIQAGTLTVAAGGSLGNTAITVSSGATLNVTGSLSASASLTTSGTVNIAAGSSGITTRKLAGLFIESGGNVTLDAAASLANRTVLTLSNLTFVGVEPFGTLDLRNNDAIIRNQSTDIVSELIGRGYNGGTWTGTDITSSSAAASTSPKAALGYRSFNGTFDGQAVTTADVIIKYTLVGDTNLDGSVNFSDLLTVAQNYNHTNSTWPNGDFNYDGTTNFSDLLGLAQNYSKVLTLSPLQLSQLDATGGSSFASAVAQAQVQVTVPEPTTVTLLCAAAVGFFGRRRRRV